MLDLMGFKEEFISRCRDALSESGPVDMEIEECVVNKAQRGELNGLLFKKKGLNCAPTFYVEDFYTAYKSGDSIAELSHQAVETAVRSLGTAEDLAKNTVSLFDRNTYEKLADSALFTVRILNKSRNKEFLNGVAYREAGCGFVSIVEIESGEYRLVVTDELLEHSGFSKDELFDKALRNTAERYPAVLQDLGESVIAGPDECSNLLDGPSYRAPAGAGPGFVLTNSRFFWGAGALFYPGVMKHIQQLLDGDYYVLPSSVHELIILKEEGQDPQQLVDMVRSANKTVVRKDEILADDLYICESGELIRVSYGGVIPECEGLVC